ncbi:PrsW family intramembrane metalloprotease [Streptacidiphilus neutrinimicus]|uniref:PrsW family intramembrane metalloprotease n=1 Tax=Streptacidiphilus neutrinimicus TaxID=105420 RepID=UPI0007C74E62|nr:PrsW family glutamic-type intramembrane protease [Streptacidiphilus neutrinimicus]
MSAAAAPPPRAPQRPPLPDMRTHRWRTCFLVGLALWLASVAVTYWTGNRNLVPTVVLLGSFLVPGSFVVWAHERYGQDLGTDRIIACFAVGGVIGVLGSSLLEYYLLRSTVWLYLGVGLIEEAVKAWALILLTRRIPAGGVRHGLVLGATVGFGFAAFESAGYAFSAVLTEHGYSLPDLVTTEILRGVLTPLGHGLWTAILGAVLFHERRGDGRFRLNLRVLLTYLGVSVLHALWDSTHGITTWLVGELTETRWQRTVFELGYLPNPTRHQVELFALFSTLGLVAVSCLGLGWLGLIVPRARREGDLPPRRRRPRPPQPPLEPHQHWYRPPAPPNR